MNRVRSWFSTRPATASNSGTYAVQGQASVSEVVDAFYSQVATDETGRGWWWVNYVLLDPDELIVDGVDDLFRVPFELSADGSVDFGDPAKVKIEFRDVNTRSEVKLAAASAIASVRGDQQVAARYTTRAETRPDEPEGGSVDVTTLRSTLGLPADTPEAEVLRVANERLEAGENPPATEEGDDAQEPQEEGGDQPSTEDDPEEGAPEGAEGEPAPLQQAARADGTVLVDAATLATLQQQASQGAAARAQQIEGEDSAYLMAAVESGKFPPARLEHWRTLMRADREGTRQTIEGLMDNVIPIGMRSVATPAGEGQGNGGGYPEHWLPDVAARKRALAASSESPRVVMEG